MVWKIGTLVPRGIGYARQIEEILKPGVQEATDGLLSLKVYYGGVLGDDEDYLRMIREGRLDGTGASAQGALMACPEMGALALPFLFSGYDEVDYVKSRLFPVFDEMLRERELKFLLWVDQGFDQFYSVNRPVTSVEDMRRGRFLTWMGPMEQAFFRRLSADFVHVEVPDFNDALRRGRADAYLGPPIWAVATQLYSVVKYINMTDVRYSPAMCTSSLSAWEALPGWCQENIEKRLTTWQDAFCRASRRDNAKALEAMRQYGLTMARSTAEEKRRMKEMLAPLGQELAGDLYPPEVLEQIRGLLAEYRDKKASR
ncbi:MAG: TRAP transporter substrate-binding protein DctP [Deltaproteobacteria bacterium]|nr:TRAP transporter substrate-binding protein DctP [Deltaproteobacteria bacterium]